MTDDSRETTEASAAALASVLFPGRQAEIQHFVDLLMSRGVDRGLLGPREGKRIWSRHIVNCVVVAPAFSPGRTVVDIGSGAGLPGLVLALARPDLRLVLVEPLLRRASFLSEAVSELAVTNVEVVRARAEQLHGERYFDFATARAVAPLERLAGWALPLVRPGGALVALKGSAAIEELAAAAAGLDRLGAGARSIHRYGADLMTPMTTVVRIESANGPS